MRDHKPRAQKSQEYKQVIGLLILVLAVATVSFSLGVAVGRRGGDSSVAGGDQQGREQVVQQTATVDSEASPEDAPKVNLTFYDTLPKGEETPLGSGINPPPATEEPAPKEAPAVESSKPDGPAATQSKAAATVMDTPVAKPKAPAVTSGEYVVQVASFKSQPDAQTLQTRLLGKGHRAFLQRVDLGDKGVWVRVYVGFFNSKESAKRVADRLIAEDKLSPMVRRRQ